MKYVPIPCERECPGRTGDCHGKCEKYKEYAEYKAWEREQKMRKPAEEYSVAIRMSSKSKYFRRYQK